ncbi:hypothetical protein Tco_0680684 [Tanacetum coccineum]|uniref:Uncharacterized protein n=1 Tax=Tanacetum coccineum TaxID=301880 RepID=A0ABQ4XL71_9ASTR
MANLIQDNSALEERLNKQGSHLYNLENLNIPQKVSKAVDEIVIDAVDWALQALLYAHFRDLPEADIKEILLQQIWETGSYKTHKDHKNLYEALEKSMDYDHSDQLQADLAKACKKRRKRSDSPRNPSSSSPLPLPPPPPLAGAFSALGTFGASRSSQFPPPHPPPFIDTNRGNPQQSSGAPSSSKTTASTQQSLAWTTSDTRYELATFTATHETSPTDNLINDDSIPDKKIQLSDDEDTGNDHLPKADMRKDWHALSISKMKAARYLDFELKLLVPEQMWINEVCTYDISAAYGISHWWFNRQTFYIERHDSLSHRREVRKHMRILSVIKIKAYSRYRYDYLSEILLRRANYQEYTIAEKDFKNLYPSDFKDLNMLLLQGHLDHLPGSDKRMLSTTLNLTKPGWDAKGFEFKNDYTIIESPRAVVFPVNNNERKIMRFNEIYKFSVGTLTCILEALDYRVKEF